MNEVVLSPARLVIVGLVLARLAGVVLAGPPLGGQGIPLRARGLLIVALALAIIPGQWSTAAPPVGSLVEVVLLAFSELLLGLAMGWGVACLFAGMQLAGQLIGQGGGLSLADVLQFDLDGELPLLSHFFYILALILFFIFDGHRMLVAALLDSFAAIPPGGLHSATPLVEIAATLLGQSFSLALRVAAPATAALLITSLALSAVSRTVPQINLLALGFGANALVTLGVLAGSMGGTAWLIQDEIATAVRSVVDALSTGF